MASRATPSPEPERVDSVVMSARVRRDVETGFRDLADATGLSYAALFGMALERLRSDAGIADLIVANKAYDAALARAVGGKGRAAGAK
jgi:hypothetical protein